MFILEEWIRVIREKRFKRVEEYKTKLIVILFRMCKLRYGSINYCIRNRKKDNRENY